MLPQTTWKNNSNALDRAQLVAAGLRQKVAIQPIFTSPAGTRHGHASHGAVTTSENSDLPALADYCWSGKATAEEQPKPVQD